MTWLDDLRTAALVGTARHPAPPAPTDLGVRPPEGLTGEALLLGQAALADAVTRAARAARVLDAAAFLEPAPPDDAPEATGEASRLLGLLLTQPPVGRELRSHLVVDWLRFAGRAGQRVPHRLLPALLDLADSKPDVAKVLHPAIGTRGLWLQNLRADGSGSPPPTAFTWADLTSRDATTQLELLRASDPGAAREHLETHWDTLGARERAAHLGTFAINLGKSDEDLLERALDDKARSVRQVACNLLDRLPASARAGRMASRLRPLLRVKGVLRKEFEIDLPPEPDVAAVRDGIPPTPASGAPDRLRQLDAIVRGAPLDVWTAVSGRSPVATLPLLKGENRVLEDIFATAEQRADLEWVRALLTVVTDLRLLHCLPVPEREDRLRKHLDSAAVHPTSLTPPLSDLPRPWGPALAAAVLEQISAPGGGYLAALLANVLPTALPPAATEQARLLLDRPDDEAERRRVLRDAVQYQSFRRSLTEAFS